MELPIDDTQLFHPPIEWIHPESSRWKYVKFVTRPLAQGLKSTSLPTLPLLPNSMMAFVLPFLDYSSLLQLRKVSYEFRELFRCCTSLSLVPLDFIGKENVFPLPLLQDNIPAIFCGSLRDLHIHAFAMKPDVMFELSFCSELVSLSINFDTVPSSLRAVNFDDEIIHEHLVIEMIQRSAYTIEELSLFDAQITRDMARMVSMLWKLKRLFLNRCLCSRKSLVYMLHNVGRQLTHLTLYDIYHLVYDRIIHSIAKRCTSLQYLCISGSNITNSGIDLLLSLPNIIFLDVSQRNRYVNHKKLAFKLSTHPRNRNYELIQVSHSYNVNDNFNPYDEVGLLYSFWVNHKQILEIMPHHDKYQFIKQLIKYYLWNEIPLPRSISGIKTCFNRLNY